MSELVIKNQTNEILTIDSREVAEMMGKNHGNLLKDIQGSGKNLGLIPVLLEGNFHVSNYFIESNYKDNSGKENKCYLVTKMGCELLGNKQQGAKGILFSAKYVERFNQMEQQLQQPQHKLPTTFKEALLMLVEAEEEKEKLLTENKTITLEKRLLSGEVFTWADRSLINSLVRTYSTTKYGDFGKGWNDYKKNLLYSHGINLNSRITAYLNKTGKKTKPKTLSLLDDSEISNAIATIISMCNEEDINISEIIKHGSENK